MKRGEKSLGLIKHRKQLQRRRKRYMELREELMIAGEIPTEPAGAIRDEQVNPASQGEQSLPGIVREAIRRGWAVPEDLKPRLVDELVGILQNPETSAKEKVASFTALTKADWNQWRQDNPDKINDARPSTVNIIVEAVEKKNNEPRVIEVVTVGSNGKQDGSGVKEAAGIPRP